MKTMKRARYLFAFLAAAVLAFALAGTALAVNNPSEPSITIKTTSTTDEAYTDTTAYTWYRIMEADIDVDPTQHGTSQIGGEVAYYVTTSDRATQLEHTDLFNVKRVGTEDKWYVELKNPESTSASQIEAAFEAATFDLSVFPSGNFAQTAVAGEATYPTTGTIPAGYYYVTSTAGTNAVIQTLAAVTIDEKNTFPPVTKAVDQHDVNAEIGNDLHYTMTVEIPTTANDTIVLTDTMTEGLTFKSIDSVKSNAEGTPDVAYTANPTTPTAVTENNNTFTITFTAETVKANQGKTITITYTAVLNNKAVIGTPDNKNTVVLDYGIHYTSKPKEAATTTYSFDFDKVDGADESKKKKLTGAKFKLTSTGRDPIELIEVEAGKTYRIAMSEDTGTRVNEITTNGNTVTINGLDTDVTYYLVETKAPTSYNKLENPIEVKAKGNIFEHQNIENNKGSVLPSTGGIGTTILYIIGGILIVGAVVFLVTRRRAAKVEESDFKSDDLS